MSSRRVLTFSVIAVLCAAAAALVPAQVPPAAPRATPHLVAVVSVDQMRADYLDRFRSLYTGGFKRLIERGAVFTNARFRHACTSTGPGHSVLLSGRSPRSSGIVHNSWYDRTLRKRVNVVGDDLVRPLGGRGRAASPARFEGFTVGDMLKAHSASSRVVGVSFKDRAAILMAGKRADAAYWYEVEGGRFITSSHYMKAAPAWLDSWNARRIPDAYAGHPWERLLPDHALYRQYAGADAVAGELDGKDTVFPHRIAWLPPADDFYDGLERTPFADTILLEFALAAMAGHHLGEGNATDLLAISFSACDVVGHSYGPDSQEMMDQMLRLDRALGTFLDEVERRAGPGGALVVLTADHGVMPLVENLQAQGLPARRVLEEDLAQTVDDALTARFPGAHDLLADTDDLEWVLDTEAIARQGLKRADVEQTVRSAALGTGVVDAVYSAAELMGPAPAADPFFDLHQRAFFAPRSGDLIGRVKKYVYLTSRKYKGGTGHGTPHDYDRHVPIVFMAPGIPPGKRDVACGPEDIAWALGRLLGLDYPQQDAATDLLPYLK
jgi:predicted AlkP superfamily pyrophosphatase or phosphodiesterase